MKKVKFGYEIDEIEEENLWSVIAQFVIEIEGKIFGQKEIFCFILFRFSTQFYGRSILFRLRHPHIFYVSKHRTHGFVGNIKSIINA